MLSSVSLAVFADRADDDDAAEEEEDVNNNGLEVKSRIFTNGVTNWSKNPSNFNKWGQKCWKKLMTSPLM